MYIVYIRDYSCPAWSRRPDDNGRTKQTQHKDVNQSSSPQIRLVLNGCSVHFIRDVEFEGCAVILEWREYIFIYIFSELFYSCIIDV